jgi:hypothetical protein
MSQIISYPDFVARAGVGELRPLSTVEEITHMAKIANALPHWFDQRRATTLIAERVGVDADLIHRLMTREGKSWKA